MTKKENKSTTISVRVPDDIINDMEVIGEEVFPVKKTNNTTNQTIYLLEKGIKAYKKEKKK